MASEQQGRGGPGGRGGRGSRGGRARWAGWAWSVARVVVAAALVWLLVSDHAGRLLRLELAALPDADPVARAELLLAADRHAEAVAVLDWAIEAGRTGGQAHEEVARLEAARARAAGAGAGWTGVLARAARGAVTGRGDDAASLAGAVASDMLVIGDVRDLAIEGARWVLDGEGDAVVAGLSAAGLVTAALPLADSAKAARRGHAATGVAGVLKGSSRTVEGALAMTGPRGARLMAIGAEGAGRAGVARAAEEVVLAVARKGEAGAVWAERRAAKLGAESVPAGAGAGAGAGARAGAGAGAGAGVGGSGAGRAGLERLAVLLRPHWIIGAAKGVWKGTLPSLVERWIESLAAAAWWLLPAAVAWLVLELWLLGARARRFWEPAVNTGRTEESNDPGPPPVSRKLACSP